GRVRAAGADPLALVVLAAPEQLLGRVAGALVVMEHAAFLVGDRQAPAPLVELLGVALAAAEQALELLADLERDAGALGERRAPGLDHAVVHQDLGVRAP